MTEGPLLAMLDDAMKGLLSVCNPAIAQGIERHVNSINEQRQAFNHVRSIKPSRVKSPNVQGQFKRIADMKQMSSDSQYDRTPAVVLQ